MKVNHLAALMYLQCLHLFDTAEVWICCVLLQILGNVHIWEV